MHHCSFIALTALAMLLAIVFASSFVATALGRMRPDRLGVPWSPDQPSLQEINLQAFPRILSPEALDDFADTYEAVWEGISAAHDDGTCTGQIIRTQVGQLRELADRINTSPTAEAIRAEADLFDRKSRRAARSLNSPAAQFIYKQCRLRIGAAVAVAEQRRGSQRTRDDAYSRFQPPA